MAHCAAVPPRKPRAPRHPLQVPARVASATGTQDARVVDISESGLLLHASRRVRPLTAVEVELFVPVLRRTLFLVGQAARVAPLGEADDAYAVGVQFTDLDPDVRELVRLIGASQARPVAPPSAPAAAPLPAFVRAPRPPSTPAPVDLRVEDTDSGARWTGRMRLSELGAAHARVLIQHDGDAAPYPGDRVRIEIAVPGTRVAVEGRVADARPLGAALEVVIVYPTLPPAEQDRLAAVRQAARLPVPRALEPPGRR